MLKPYEVNAALKSVFLGTEFKRTVLRNPSSNYAKTLKGEYSTEVSLLCYETYTDGGMHQSSNYDKTLKGDYSAENSYPWYET